MWCRDPPPLTLRRPPSVQFRNLLMLQLWEEKLKTTHFPEMIFGNSSLILKHLASGTKIHFNAFDSLIGWKQEALPPVEVPAAAKWKFRRFFPVTHVQLSIPGNSRHQIGRMLAVDAFCCVLVMLSSCFLGCRGAGAGCVLGVCRKLLSGCCVFVLPDYAVLCVAVMWIRAVVFQCS